jgi:hypothetical protein
MSNLNEWQKQHLGPEAYAWWLRKSEGRTPEQASVLFNLAQRWFGIAKGYIPVPPDFVNIDLASLSPSPKSSMSLERQAKVIGMLKERPAESWAFFGEAGTGKSTWMHALYYHGLLCQCVEEESGKNPNVGMGCSGPVVYISAKRLLDQHTDWAMNKNNPESNVRPPVLSVELIERRYKNGCRAHLFLEEIDKFRGTEAKYSNLFEVLDALTNYRGQLVMASNLTWDEFKAGFGLELARRIEKLCKGGENIVEMF